MTLKGHNAHTSLFAVFGKQDINKK